MASCQAFNLQKSVQGLEIHNLLPQLIMLWCKVLFVIYNHCHLGPIFLEITWSQNKKKNIYSVKLQSYSPRERVAIGDTH
jgi:hypothetical protein